MAHWERAYTPASASGRRPLQQPCPARVDDGRDDGGGWRGASPAGHKARRPVPAPMLRPRNRTNGSKSISTAATVATNDEHLLAAVIPSANPRRLDDTHAAIGEHHR